ncbi:hypothetical protein GCM10010234_38760 [Streptomyces hawaiiensis]
MECHFVPKVIAVCELPWQLSELPYSGMELVVRTVLTHRFGHRDGVVAPGDGAGCVPGRRAGTRPAPEEVRSVRRRFA